MSRFPSSPEAERAQLLISAWGSGVGQLLSWSSGAAGSCPTGGQNPPPFILRLIPSLAGDLPCKGESRRGVTTVPDGRCRHDRHEGAGTPYKALLITVSEIYFSRSQAGVCMTIFIRSACTKWQRGRVGAVGKFLFAPVARDNALAAPRPSIPRSSFVRRRRFSHRAGGFSPSPAAPMAIQGKRRGC